jgi:hypothetical protein
LVDGVDLRRRGDGGEKAGQQGQLGNRTVEHGTQLPQAYKGAS